MGGEVPGANRELVTGARREGTRGEQRAEKECGPSAAINC